MIYRTRDSHGCPRNIASLRAPAQVPAAMVRAAIQTAHCTMRSSLGKLLTVSGR